MSLFVEISLEAPKLFFKPNSSISAPLKTFLIERLPPKPIPKSWIFEWEKSKSNPKENFSLGVSIIDVFNELKSSSNSSWTCCC